MSHHLSAIRVIAVAAALVTLTSAASAQDPNRLTIPFSDPSRPGTVKVNLFQGRIRVTGTAGKDVVVQTDDTIVTTRQGREVTVPQRPETVGLRRLTQRSGLRIEEENNVISIASGRFMNGGDVSIEVPVRTNLNVTGFNDEILVGGVDGEIEVTTTNGQITLTDVMGALVAHATNGEVRATVKQVTPDRPMSFTSLNGDVDVTLPATVKANLKLRSDRGDVYTDFDVQLQQRPSPSPARGRGFSAGRPTPPLPPLPPAAPLPPVARQPPVAQQPPLPPQPPQPPFSPRDPKANLRLELENGVYGTVNGGGPEFELRTFNGDVYLRRAK